LKFGGLSTPIFRAVVIFLFLVALGYTNYFLQVVLVMDLFQKITPEGMDGRVCGNFLEFEFQIKTKISFST